LPARTEIEVDIRRDQAGFIPAVTTRSASEAPASALMRAQEGVPRGSDQ